MQIQRVTDTSMDGWDHYWCAFVDKPNVTDQRFVENRCDQVPVVATAFGEPTDFFMWGRVLAPGTIVCFVSGTDGVRLDRSVRAS